MKKNIEKIIELPENVEIEINESEITVKSGERELKRKFNLRDILLTKGKKEIKISAKKSVKRVLKMIGTISAHIRNMINGLEEGFVYKMEICNVHFPMNVKVEGEKMIIKSFLGEVRERSANILPKTRVEINGKEIIISSPDKEAAGQTAANIEKATKLKGKDRRIFQDGIFITQKPRRNL